jgi:hypothetical protein
MSVDVHGTTRRFNTKDGTPHITAVKEKFSFTVDLFNDALET